MATAKALKSCGLLKEKNLDDAAAILAAVDQGCPLQLNEQNAIHQNSLQVIYSSRFVFSPTDDFTLAKSMIVDSPNLRFGPSFDLESKDEP